MRGLRFEQMGGSSQEAGTAQPRFRRPGDPLYDTTSATRLEPLRNLGGVQPTRPGVEDRAAIDPFRGA